MLEGPRWHHRVVGAIALLIQENIGGMSILGGSGSTRWNLYRRRRRVEETFAISISDVARIVDLKDLSPGPGSVRPVKPTTYNKVASAVRCEVDLGEDDNPLLKLSYLIPSKWGFEYQIEDVVRLQTTRVHFGGARYWFTCPRQECSRRVAKLYRLPEERYFACRLCLDLSYRSSQQAHKFDSFCSRVADENSGEVFRAVKGAFTPHKSGAGRREAGAKLLDAFMREFGEAKEQRD